MQKPCPLTRHLMWAATLSLGFGTLWPVVIGWLGSSTATRAGVAKQIVIQRDGTPLVQEYEDSDYSSPIYHDLEGKLVDVSPRDKFADAVLMSTERRGHNPRPSLDWSTRLAQFAGPNQSKIIWYFVHDGKPEGSGVFEGFHLKSRTRIGFIGRAGFTTQQPSADQRIPVSSDLMSASSYSWTVQPTMVNRGNLVFASVNSDLRPLESVVFVPSERRVLKVDLQERVVRQLFESPEPIRSISVARIPADSKEGDDGRLVLIGVAGKVYALTPEGKLMRTVTITAELDSDHGYSNWYELLGGNAEIVVSRESPDGRHTPTEIYTVSADGTIESKREFILDSGVDPTNPKLEALLVSSFFPAPALLALGGLVVVPLFEVSNGAKRTIAEAALRYAIDGWPAFAFVLVISLLLAAWGRRRAVAYALSDREKRAWTIYIVLLGVPGFAGYLLHRPWPAREKCPSCPAKPPRDRDACANCGTPFPEPALKGTEIFA